MADFTHFAPSPTQGRSGATSPPARRTRKSNASTAALTCALTTTSAAQSNTVSEPKETKSSCFHIKIKNKFRQTKTAVKNSALSMETAPSNGTLVSLLHFLPVPLFSALNACFHKQTLMHETIAETPFVASCFSNDCKHLDLCKRRNLFASGKPVISDSRAPDGSVAEVRVLTL